MPPDTSRGGQRALKATNNHAVARATGVVADGSPRATQRLTQGRAAAEPLMQLGRQVGRGLVVHDAFSWRDIDIDTELAELVFNSLLDADQATLVRGPAERRTSGGWSRSRPRS